MVVEDTRACLVRGGGAVVGESARVCLVIIEDTVALYLAGSTELEISHPRSVVTVGKWDLNYTIEVFSGCPVANNRSIAL